MISINLVIIFFVLYTILLIESYQIISQPSYIKKSNVNSMTMKGKGNRVPIDQRGEFLKQQRMMEAKSKIEKEKPSGIYT